jgi:DNA-binding response OmpR family regulator
MSLAVLVIENDESVAGLLMEIFSQEGWNVSTPRGGASVARSLLGDNHYDLITVSYRFHSTNGVEMIRLIREIEHRKETPVLMITGMPDVTGEALEMGANEVLIKPIEPSMLVAAVKRHTRNRDSAVTDDRGESRTRERRSNWQRRELSSMVTFYLTGKNN